MEGGAQKTYLLLSEVPGILGGPEIEHILVFAHDAVSRTRRVDEDAVEEVVEVAGEHRAGGLAHDEIGDAAAFEITDERGHAFAAHLVEQQ